MTLLERKLSKNDISQIINSKKGFKNLGNTCFMNTCLQNLIHTEYFIKLLFSKKDLISKDTPISYQFIKLCLELISNADNNDVISPDEFKYAFGNKHRMFKGFRQHDTQEFCRILLEDMNQELNEIKTPAPYKELITVNKKKFDCDKEFDEIFKSRENSLIIECFYSQIINIFKCKCNFETFSFQKLLDFPLLLPQKSSSKEIDIKDLLNEYFKEDEINFQTKCEKCHKIKTHTKIVKFSQPPNILILSLQRINARTEKKNKCLVKFPEYLDIKDYIDKDCGYINENIYELYGIGNHVGDINFGHYYAYIKLNGKKWYEFNDSSVNRYSEFENITSSSYSLFYKKKQ